MKYRVKLRPQDLPARVEELSGTAVSSANMRCTYHHCCYVRRKVVSLGCDCSICCITKLSTIYLTVKSLGYTRKVENATSKVLVSLRNLRTQPRGWDGQHRRDQIAKR